MRGLGHQSEQLLLREDEHLLRHLRGGLHLRTHLHRGRSPPHGDGSARAAVHRPHVATDYRGGGVREGGAGMFHEGEVFLWS